LTLAIRKINTSAEELIQAFVESTNSKKYGSIPGKKPCNVVHLLFENWNGISLWQKGWKAINNINALIRRFKADAIFGCKTQCD